MRDYLLVHLNGKPLRVENADAFETVSDFLRKRQRLTGTKVVCAEGDCGACAVMVGRVNAAGTGITYRSVASCIQTMFQLDGAHLVTVEGLSEAGERNAVQDSMVKCHGSQCGFCTPGFVVSLCDLMQAGQPVDATTARRGLVGNLCRCTGYESIVKAAVETDRLKLRSIDTVYPPKQLLAAMSAASEEEVRVEAKDLIFYKPVTIQSAIAFRHENQTCLILSGATDLGVQRNKALRQFTTVMSTAGLKPMRELKVTDKWIEAGGAVTLSELESATATIIPELSHFLTYFGSPMIKNAATIGGNLCNASPIGDSIPAMMVLGASVEVAGANGSRSVPISEFYTGYRKTVLAADDMLTRVTIPLPSAAVIFKLYKVSKRKHLDISSVSVAIWMKLVAGRIDEIRIAFGGVAATVVRLSDVEAMLVGKEPSLEAFEAAGAAAAAAVRPLTDVRGSDQYRLQLVENLLVKFWYDLEASHFVGAEPVPSLDGILNR